jgi:hypothetical protein
MPDQKQLANLQAQAALLGAVLEPSTDDADRTVFIVTAGAATRALETLEAVGQYLGSLEPAEGLL